MAFAHFEVGEDVWLSACCECSQLAALAVSEEELEEGEQQHRCSSNKERTVRARIPITLQNTA
jgi:hypothetical protein